MSEKDLGELTEYVREYIVTSILDGIFSPGDKLPSERKMMTIAGTGRITVRRAYESLQNDGIVTIRHGSGAFVETNVRGFDQKTKSIAVLGTLTDFFSLEFIDAIECAVRNSDSYLVLRQTEQDYGMERTAAKQLWRLGIRNFVVWPSGIDFDTSLFYRLKVLGSNIVFFDRMRPGAYADFVGTDNDHAITLILEDALSQGIKDFTFISYKEQPWASFVAREQAFHRICAEKGLSGTLVRVPWHDEAAHFLNGRSRDIMSVLKKDEAFHAIKKMAQYWFSGTSSSSCVICVNDYIALQVKLIYPELAVYGIDGLPEAIEQGVISYKHSMVELAHAAIDLLETQQKMQNQWIPTNRLVKGQLIRAYP